MQSRFSPGMLAGAGGAILVLLLIGGYLFWDRLSRLDDQVERLAGRLEEVLDRVDRTAVQSREAQTRAGRAEELALQAAAERQKAEEEREQAERLASEVRQEAEQALHEAESAKQEAQRLVEAREMEMNRLQERLGRIVETRRTALGLVMNLGSDTLQFDFDRAALRPENRELLSRIAGVLLTSEGYGVYVYGHTDDIGSEDYNQRLSERRAEAVRDYLVEVGIDPGIIRTKGFGKARPLISETTPEARAQNRRVEIGIIDATVHYEGPLPDSSPDS